MIEDWKDKVHRAIERITEQYDNIGRMTGIPVLGVIVSPETEENALNEWRIQVNTLNGYVFHEIDVLELSIDEVERFGVDNIVEMIKNPMPGSNPESELGNIWIQSIVDKIINYISSWDNTSRLVIFLSNLGALYPASTPRAIIQSLLERREIIKTPIIFFIPGSLTEPRAYRFMNLVDEFMYRGDLI